MRIACCAVVVSILLLFSLNGAFAEDVVPVTQIPETIHVTLLPVQDGFSIEPPRLTEKTVPFEKEPSFGGKKIRRGFASDGCFNGYAWDEVARKLYVDFNNNNDLTDDPESVYSGTTLETCLGFKVSDVRLQRKIDGDIAPAIVDFQFYSGGSTYKKFKSGWVGEFEVNGQHWRLGVGDNFTSERIFDSRGFSSGTIFLTHADTHSVFDEKIMGSSFAPIKSYIFLAGVMGKFSFAFNRQPVSDSDKTRLVIDATIQIERPETYPVRLNGKFIDYLVLRQVGEGLGRSNDELCHAVFPQPGDELRLPVGNYEIGFVSVGKNPAFKSNCFQIPDISVGPKCKAVLNVGGPLQTKVDMKRWGSTIQLNAKIVGLSGENYWPVVPAGRNKRPQTPKVAVYKGDQRILLAQLEYG